MTGQSICPCILAVELYASSNRLRWKAVHAMIADAGNVVFLGAVGQVETSLAPEITLQSRLCTLQRLGACAGAQGTVGGLEQ